MAREFKGRPVMPGSFTGEALVSRQGMNILASVQKDVMAEHRTITCADQNNPDLYGKVLTGKIICLPRTIGSTTGGMLLQLTAKQGSGPAALLFAETIDSLALAGVVLAKVWYGKAIVAGDGLGPDFLGSVQDGVPVSISEDGTVRIEE